MQKKGLFVCRWLLVVTDNLNVTVNDFDAKQSVR